MVKAAHCLHSGTVYDRPTLKPIPRYHRKIDDLFSFGKRIRLDMLDQSRLPGGSSVSEDHVHCNGRLTAAPRDSGIPSSANTLHLPGSPRRDPIQFLARMHERKI